MMGIRMQPPTTHSAYSFSGLRSSCLTRNPLCSQYWFSCGRSEKIRHPARSADHHQIMAKGGLNGAMAVAILMTIMAAMIVAGNADISCNTVISTLLPCVPFAAGSAAQPSQACCNGVRSLNSAAKTTPDRQAVCNCIKAEGRSISINYSKASKLPGLCGVNTAFPISASTDCAAIH